MFDFLTSPKVYAVDCVVTTSQLTARALYLKEPILEATKVKLYDENRNLVAIVFIEPTSIQTHQNVTLPICQ